MTYLTTVRCDYPTCKNIHVIEGEQAQRPYLPPGWTKIGDKTFCNVHPVIVRQGNQDDESLSNGGPRLEVQ